MPKRFSKNKSSKNEPSAQGKPSRPATENSGRGAGRDAGSGATGVNAADTESEFSVPQKWQENEQENANASSGPPSAARDGERSEEAADSKPS